MRKFEEFVIFLSIGLLHQGAAAQDANLRFSPEPGLSAEVQANGSEVTVTVKSGNNLITEKLEIETENSLKLVSDDYNFDGKADFSISHLDDGMGTYTISQIYVYSSKAKKFELLRPKCGDEFINVVISKKSRSLINSYITDNQFKTCTSRY